MNDINLNHILWKLHKMFGSCILFYNFAGDNNVAATISSVLFMCEIATDNVCLFHLNLAPLLIVKEKVVGDKNHSLWTIYEINSNVVNVIPASYTIATFSLL